MSLELWNSNKRKLNSNRKGPREVEGAGRPSCSFLAKLVTFEAWMNQKCNKQILKTAGMGVYSSFQIVSHGILRSKSKFTLVFMARWSGPES